MAVEISDIFGLGKGMEKLLDITNSALGRLTKSYFNRKDIKDRIYEIKMLSNAIKQNQIETGGISVDGENISIQSASDLPSYKDLLDKYSDNLHLRAKNRLAHQAINSQLNIESIILHASELLLNENDVNEAPVNSDWINKFFSIATEISTDEMQDIWGKVLAGEIKQPDSFSMRTLDVIRNLNQWEAQRISFIANYTCHSFFHYFLISEWDLMKKYDIHFLEITELIECGYLQPNEISFNTDSNGVSIFVFGDLELEVNHKEKDVTKYISGYQLTTAAIQINKLIDRKVNFDFIKDLAKKLSKDGSTVSYKKGDELINISFE